MHISELSWKLRHTVRNLWRAPGLLVFAAAALALGVAGPTTMFSIAHGVLQDLPVRGGDRLVHVLSVRADDPGVRLSLRPHDLILLREQLRTVTGLAAFTYTAHDVAAPGERPERRSGARVTANAFRLLGVAPALGRDFTDLDAVPGAPAVALIADDLWRTRFGADPQLPGRVVRLDGIPTTVIGIMPPGFRFPSDQQIWTPAPLAAAAPPAIGGWQYIAFGRLAPGRSLADLGAELAVLAAHLESAHPEANAGVSFRARPYREQMLDRDLRRILRVMVALVSCVLLVAAANVANLLLARSAARSRSVAIRGALGASRGDIVAEQLLEAAVLALAGGAAGLALSRAAIALFTRALAADLPYWAEFRLAWPVLLFAAACIVAAALAAGLLPALQASRIDLLDALRDESRGASSFRRSRSTGPLVAAQIACSTALLIVSGLMIKGVMIMSGSAGFEPERILTARYELRSPRYEADRITDFHRDLLERLGADGRVRAVAATSDLPGMGTGQRSIEIEGTHHPADGYPRTHVAVVSPGYAAAAGASALLRGRDFDWSDSAGQPPVALVNTAFARRFYPESDPVGRRFRLHGAGEPGPWITVVGLVPSFGIRTDAGSADDAVYLPLAQHSRRSVALMANVAGDPLEVLPALLSTLHDADPDLPLLAANRLDRAMAAHRAAERVFGVLFASFGGAALLLATIGLYGTMTFSVALRTRELGIRAALGATRRRLLWLALRAGLVQIAAGAAAGIILALLAAPLFGAALFGVGPRDPAVYALVTVMLVATALAAALAPAWRAARIHPSRALQESGS